MLFVRKSTCHLLFSHFKYTLVVNLYTLFVPLDQKRINVSKGNEHKKFLTTYGHTIQYVYTFKCLMSLYTWQKTKKKQINKADRLLSVFVN